MYQKSSPPKKRRTLLVRFSPAVFIPIKMLLYIYYFLKIRCIILWISRFSLLSHTFQMARYTKFASCFYASQCMHDLHSQ